MEKINLLSRSITLIGLSAILAGAVTALLAADKKLVVGFSQVGAESGWRTANTDSIKAEAAKRGIELNPGSTHKPEDNARRFDGRMVFVPERQHDSSQARSAWNHQ